MSVGLFLNKLHNLQRVHLKSHCARSTCLFYLFYRRHFFFSRFPRKKLNAVEKNCRFTLYLGKLTCIASFLGGGRETCKKLQRSGENPKLRIENIDVLSFSLSSE